ncbi:hypothetical protein HDU93_005364, partial [Gonapodya sp. JEL0774]
GNSFTGAIPDLSKMSDLTVLDLSGYQKFTGFATNGLVSNTNLTEVNLAAYGDGPSLFTHADGRFPPNLTK